MKDIGIVSASHLHCTAGSSKSFTAIRKDAGLYCGSRLRSGEVFVYVGSTQNLKDLKDGNHPVDTHREPSALYCWIFEILYCDPKGRKALLRVPSTVGRSVCLCWEHSNPKGPKDGFRWTQRRQASQSPQSVLWRDAFWRPQFAVGSSLDRLTKFSVLKTTMSGG